jgi:hypothetical protein
VAGLTLEASNPEECGSNFVQANFYPGRVVAQAVSRWLPTAAARFRVRVEHVWFVVDKAALGQVFSEYFVFPCQSSFHQFLHHHNHPGLVKQAYWWP